MSIVMEGDEVRIESPLAAVRASAGIAGRLPHPMTWEEIKEVVREARAEAHREHTRRNAEGADADAAAGRQVTSVG